MSYCGKVATVAHGTHSRVTSEKGWFFAFLVMDGLSCQRCAINAFGASDGMLPKLHDG